MQRQPTAECTCRRCHGPSTSHPDKDGCWTRPTCVLFQKFVPVALHAFPHHLCSLSVRPVDCLDRTQPPAQCMQCTCSHVKACIIAPMFAACTVTLYNTHVCTRFCSVPVLMHWPKHDCGVTQLRHCSFDVTHTCLPRQFAFSMHACSPLSAC
jgi:hypothetical protein